MEIFKKDVEYIANLARLNFSDEEKENLIIDLNSVLGYMEKLNELNTENIDIIVNPYYLENKFRDDEMEPFIELNSILANALDKFNNYVTVPTVIE